MNEQQRRPGRPAQLSREQIVDALSSVDNVDTVTMRELAARLDVRHSALYRWIGNRDELFDLISEVVIGRILPATETTDGSWQDRLAAIAWAVHDEFRSLPGYATHLSRPHTHNAHSLGRLRQAVLDLLAEAGDTLERGEQSWHIFITTVVSWLALAEQPLEPGMDAPRFDLLLDVLLRGLPAREPGIARPQYRRDPFTLGA